MNDDELLKKQAEEKGWVVIPEDQVNVGENRVQSSLFSPVTTHNKSERVSMRMSIVEKEWLEKVASTKQSSTSEIIRDALSLYKRYVEDDGDV